MLDFDTLKPIITGLLRHLLTGVGSLLVTYGGLTPDQSTAFIGGLAMLIVSAVSLVISKYLQEKKVETALELPANSSKEKLAQEMKLK